MNSLNITIKTQRTNRRRLEKEQDPTLCCRQGNHFEVRFKLKRWRNMYPVNTN